MPRPCLTNIAWRATPGTHARDVVGVGQVRPVRDRSSALRSHAPDAARPALRADGTIVRHGLVPTRLALLARAATRR